jgi:hypothetical protein
LRVREGTERRGHMRGGARVEVSVTDAGWLSVDADGVEGGVECVVIPDASSRGGIERGRLVKMVGGHLLLGREGRTGAQDTGAGWPKRNVPGLNQARPQVIGLEPRSTRALGQSAATAPPPPRATDPLEAELPDPLLRFLGFPLERWLEPVELPPAERELEAASVFD